MVKVEKKTEKMEVKIPEKADKPVAKLEEDPWSEVEKLIGKEAAKNVAKWMTAILEKFHRYIRAVALFGSQKTGKGKTKTSDIDVAVIIDDTDVKRMGFVELKERLFQSLVEMAMPIDKRIHPQPYLLTEIWKYLKEGTPVILNMLRDSVVVYDTGVLIPLKLLLQKGELLPGKEAADKHINIAEELIKLIKDTFTTKLTYNMEQAVVSAAQAVLMELGEWPPVPKVVPDEFKRVVIDKYKLADPEYYEIAKHVIKTYKDVEHGERKEVSGEEVGKLYEETKKFVSKCKNIIAKLRKEKGEEFKTESKEDKKVEVRRDGIVEIKREDTLNLREKQIMEQLGER